LNCVGLWGKGLDAFAYFTVALAAQDKTMDMAINICYEARWSDVVPARLQPADFLLLLGCANICGHSVLLIRSHQYQKELFVTTTEDLSQRPSHFHLQLERKVSIRMVPWG
jgi:hypothetical protein